MKFIKYAWHKNINFSFDVYLFYDGWFINRKRKKEKK